MSARVEELEAALRKCAADLEAVDAELGSFLYAVAHDLRAPLRAILGFGGMLEEDWGDRLDDDGRDFLQRIREAASKMDSLIADLRRLATVSSGELRRQPVDVSAIATSIAAALAASDPARRVDFAIEPGLVVDGDPALVRTVLEQLLDNAWKFTSRHATAKIEVTNEEGRTILVRDDGAGFDPDYAGKLFTPFQRLHSSAEFAGNGIGLAIVRRIVQRHGGRVRAEGTVEGGATIRFTL